MAVKTMVIKTMEDEWKGVGTPWCDGCGSGAADNGDKDRLDEYKKLGWLNTMPLYTPMIWAMAVKTMVIKTMEDK